MSAYDYSGQTVLVTGATGFLGGAVARKLAEQGAIVRALVRRPNRDRYIRNVSNIEQVEGDLSKPETLKKAVESSDYVFHCAAQIGGKLALQRKINVLGTRNLAIAAADTNIKRFIHVSTIAVYGYQYRDTITEDTVQVPGKVPYNISKSEAETALKNIAIQKDFSYAIVRPGMIYGARSGAWTLAMLRLAKLNPTPFISDGIGTAYPIHVDDLVDLMLVVGQQDNADKEAFNAVMKLQPTWREFLGSYMAMVGHDNWLSLPYWLVIRNAFFVDMVMQWMGETQDIRSLVPFVTSNSRYSMKKAKELLDWQPEISLEKGMKMTAAWLIEEGYL